MSLEVIFLGQIFRAAQMLNFQWNQPFKSWPTFLQAKVGKKKEERKEEKLFWAVLKWNMVMQTNDFFSLIALLQCSTLNDHLSLWASPLLSSEQNYLPKLSPVCWVALIAFAYLSG